MLYLHVDYQFKICAMENEKERLIALSEGSERALEEFFTAYYKDLLLFAGTYIPDAPTCEDIVQQVFVSLWEKRKEAAAIVSMKSFLLKSVQNACVSELRRLNVKSKYEELAARNPEIYARETEDYLFYSELQEQLELALQQLTPVQRQCFEMNRLQGLKQREIAEKLNIPLRTVELRISEALKFLRRHLQDYYPLLAFLLNL